MVRRSSNRKKVPVTLGVLLTAGLPIATQSFTITAPQSFHAVSSLSTTTTRKNNHRTPFTPVTTTAATTTTCCRALESAEDTSSSSKNADVQIDDDGNSNNINMSSNGVVKTKESSSSDTVTATLERAKAILEKSKQKLAKKQEQQQPPTDEFTTNGATASVANGANGSSSTNGIMINGKSTAAVASSSTVPLPFFASIVMPSTRDRRKNVIKSINESGLITIDGEKMASLSEQEEWEVRGLLDVFENEMQPENVDGTKSSSAASKQLANRDVAASIFNLRKSLQQEDYRRIFDKRNRFIGEDN